MGSEDVESTGFFRDGVRRIDIVLVILDGKYEEDVEKIKIDFLINVVKIGLEVEVEAGVMRRLNKHIFVKIHAPDPVLEEFGRYYNVRKYFKAIHNEFINPKTNLFYMKNEKELIKNIRENFPGRLNYTNVERSTIVYHILFSLPFGQYKNHVGLERLIERNIILDAYALHDGPYFLVRNQSQNSVNARQVLFYNWVGKLNLFRTQPVHLIREYFGEKVAFYFAFYEYFNISLLFATGIGIFVTIESLSDIKDDEVIKEACSDSDTNSDSVRTVCPLCRDFNTCPFRNLTDFCVKVTITNFIDNPWTVMHCILISLWAMLFILLWRRRKNYLSWLWEYNLTDTKNAIRSAFHTDVHEIRTSKLTGIVIDTEKKTSRIFRLVLMIFSLFFWALLVLTVTILLIICKYELSAEFQKISNIWRDYLAVITITCIYVFVMGIFQKFSHILSRQLTRLENYKTYNSFQDAFILKLFGFCFLCNFALLIYYYFLNMLYTYPSDKSRWYLIGGIGMMNCGPESCLDEQCVVLVVTVLVKQYLMNVPALFLKSRTDYTKCGHDVPFWEREYLLKPLTEFVMIEKFTDLVLKFTLVGLFGTTFPLTPLLLLISGVCIIRYEARQFLVCSRRPLLLQPASQQIWHKIMLAVVYAVPCFNTLAMTSMTTMLHYSRTSHKISYFVFSMGKFVTEDYKLVSGSGSPAEALKNYKGFVPDECLFPGLMFRSKKYDGQYYPIERFWRIRYDKHKLMLEVEHLALLLMAILHYVIPAYPRDIKDAMLSEEIIKHRRT